MTPLEMLEMVREFYESQWPDKEFPTEAAIELIAKTEERA